MTVVIRPAIADDREDLFRVALASWLDAYRDVLPAAEVADAPAMITRALDSRLAALRIAILDGRIAGYYSLGPPDDPERTNYLWHLYVDPPLQRRGVGRALNRAALVEIKSRGNTLAWLDVLAGNIRALAFYRALGWIETGRDQHGHYDLILMQSQI
jgi:ribosomal protein S18 acetylase RimI-like enzyme